jgi:Ca-activated chloride channel homolog
MRFEHPQILWLLPFLPAALAALFWFANRQRQKLLAQFVSARLLPTLTTGISPARQKLRFAFLILAIASLVVALARPQYGFDLEEVSQNGLDIVVAIDTSKSMLVTDIAPNRLQRAKLAALELMQDAKSDRLGLVAFAGEAFLECPLTIDDTAFQQSVQALDVNSIPEGGTAIAEAINTALTAFKEKDHYKALILFTDGEDNVNEAAVLAAAQNAAKAGLKIFTIGIGTANGDLIRVTDANGNSDYVRDEQGNVVKSHLNEALLQKISGATGGFYLPLRGADAIDTLYNQGLAPMPKSEGKEKLVKRYHEQFQWPLAITILFLLAEMFFPERKKSKIQNPKSKVEIQSIAALIIILLIPVGANASPSSALRDYKNGNFTNALEQFQQLAQTQTNDLRLVFNAGDAAYRATNFDLAQNLFSQVTLAPDLKIQQRAYYNLGNTQYRAGELKFAPSMEGLDAMEESWKAALQSYSRAAQLNTNDVDAAYDFGFVKKQIEILAQLREAIRQAKMSADEAVRRAQFHRALEIMEQLTQNKIAAKQFQDYIKKLKDIDAIATPKSK